KFGAELHDLCRGIDDRPITPDRPRKSLSTEQTYASDLVSLGQCEEKLGELYEDLMAELAQKEGIRPIGGIFVKLKFSDFSRTTVDRAHLEPSLEGFRELLAEAYARTEKNVRLIGVGVRFADFDETATQLALL